MNGPMKPNPEQKARAARRFELLHARLDGTLTPAGAAELDRLLADDPAAGAEAAAFDRLARMACAARVRAPDDLAERVLAAATARERAPGDHAQKAATAREPAVSGGVLERLRRAFTLPRLTAPAFAQALAALVLLVLLATLTLRPGVRNAPDSGGATVAEAVTHRFEFSAPEAHRVCLVGDFNNWKVCEAPLSKDEATGLWTVLLSLPPGRHEYMFVVDEGSWILDPAAPVRVDDGFGNQNGVLFL